MLRYTGIFALSMALYVMPVSGVGPVVCKSREKKWSGPYQLARREAAPTPEDLSRRYPKK